MNVIENLVVTNPPINEQYEIANYLDKITTEIEYVAKNINCQILKLLS